MNQLDDALPDLVIAVTTPDGTPDSVFHCVREVMGAMQDVDAATINRVLACLADMIAGTDGPRASAVAIGCGALVEGGGDPTIALGSILSHLPALLSSAYEFVQACEQRAEAEESDEESEAQENPMERFGAAIAEGMPGEGLAWLSLKPMCLGAIAMLSRSKPSRKNVPARELLQSLAQPLSEVQGDVSYLGMLLRVLDDEELIVLHPEMQRGYRVVISGLADNFQLHTLLADALLGDPAKGWLPGARPDPRVVAAARDEPLDPEATSAAGAFDLWTWRGLQSDGRLMEVNEGNGHWIWNEGVPADIPPFEGVRVVLLGPPPYQRAWSAGRRFDGMVGELRVMETLPAGMVKTWLDRIARTPR